MNTFFTDALTHWKSTVSSILTATLFTTAGLMAYPPIMAHTKLMAWLGGVQIVGKIWVGLISQDAGVVLAVTPGNPTPHAEASHEVPDTPTASVVKKDN